MVQNILRMILALEHHNGEIYSTRLSFQLKCLKVSLRSRKSTNVTATIMLKLVSNTKIHDMTFIRCNITHGAWFNNFHSHVLYI